MTQTLAAALSNLIRSADHFHRLHPDGCGDVVKRIETLVRETMPSGAGFDAGTTIDLGKSTPNNLVFHTSFHHMNEAGMYDGWTEHKVTVTPDFVVGTEIKVSGRNRNDIKDYIGEVFSEAMEDDAPADY